LLLTGCKKKMKSRMRVSPVTTLWSIDPTKEEVFRTCITCRWLLRDMAHQSCIDEQSHPKLLRNSFTIKTHNLILQLR